MTYQPSVRRRYAVPEWVPATTSYVRTPVLTPPLLKARRRRHLEESEVTKPTPVTRHAMVVLALRFAAEHGMSEDDTARLVIAWQGGQRMALGITGPCSYCGDAFANSVDHINPHIAPRWGVHAANEPDNLTSACYYCNTSKGKRTPEEWRAAMVGKACRVRSGDELDRLRRMWGAGWFDYGMERVR